jgi:transcriptional regulator with XRE-family HTH domain
MKFGEAIKQKREQLGMTQQDLAERLFVSRQTVCRWENGSRCPDLIMAKKIALVLGISMDELIPGEAVQDYTPPKEPPVDISCVKVMLTGIFLLVLGAFLLQADAGFFMEFSGLCLIAGVIVFAVGLFIPMHKKDAIVDDTLPQRQCPQCGKQHDFDYPKCPHCEYDYLAK